MARAVLLALAIAVIACGTQPSPSSSGDGAAGAGVAGAPGGGEGGTVSGGGMAGAGGEPDPPIAPRVLLFTKVGMGGHHHSSIPPAVAALAAHGTARGWTVSASEDGALFADATLAGYDVVVFLHTHVEVLDAAQQAAFERFIQSGRGFVGIHSASDTHVFSWPWYRDLVGAKYGGHPPQQPASIVVDTIHPSTAHLTSPWTFDDEWYFWEIGPSPDVTIVLSVDESTYDPGIYAMGASHPIAWFHDYDGGRAFYTALGHPDAAWADARLIEHVAGGIVWASGLP